MEGGRKGGKEGGEKGGMEGGREGGEKGGREGGEREAQGQSGRGNNVYPPTYTCTFIFSLFSLHSHPRLALSSTQQAPLTPPAAVRTTLNKPVPSSLTP